MGVEGYRPIWKHRMLVNKKNLQFLCIFFASIQTRLLCYTFLNTLVSLVFTVIFLWLVIYLNNYSIFHFIVSAACWVKRTKLGSGKSNGGSCDIQQSITLSFSLLENCYYPLVSHCKLKFKLEILHCWLQSKYWGTISWVWVSSVKALCAILWPVHIFLPINHNV